jgi:hypothetical protein
VLKWKGTPVPRYSVPGDIVGPLCTSYTIPRIRQLLAVKLIVLVENL